MSLILESERDRRVLEWLISQVGETAVTDACTRVAGARRAYVSNIAKVLSLTPPSDLALTSRDDAKKYLEAIKKLLNTHSIKGDVDGPT